MSELNIEDLDVEETDSPIKRVKSKNNPYKKGYTVDSAANSSGLCSLPVKVVEETEDGVVIHSTEDVNDVKAAEASSSSKPSQKRRKTSKTVTEVKEVEKIVIQEVEKPVANRYTVNVTTDFGIIVSDCYDISISDSLVVLCYHKDLKGTRFNLTKPGLVVDIEIITMETGDAQEYTVSPVGVSFTMESSNIFCTLLEIV